MPTQTGIYREYLQNLWVILQRKPEVAVALQQTIAASDSLQLEPLIAYQLESLGLVKLEGNTCIISCELYRLYFQEQNFQNKSYALVLQELEQENEKLQSLVNLDPLTQVANFPSFNNHFQTEWERMAELAEPISLIVCNIDYFKIYNEIYGHQKGDDCLRQVAQAICQIVQRPIDLVARYWGEDFVIFLPQTDAIEALSIAEAVRLNLKKMALPFKSHKFGGLPNHLVTLSLGVACTIPTSNDLAKTLLLEAEKALYEAKRAGRNCIAISSVLNFRF
jgi:diguanylate cyclase (GGDEF)-like protein